MISRADPKSPTVCDCPPCSNLDQHWLRDIVSSSPRSLVRRTSTLSCTANTVASILDVNGVHSLQWAVELAQRYPSAHVTHLAQRNVFQQTLVPQNCSVRMGHVLDGQVPPTGLFDLVHARFMLLSQPTAMLPHLFKRLFQLTRPGGRVELYDSTSLMGALVPLTTNLPRLNASLKVKMAKSGVVVHGLNHYSTWLYEAGFSKVDMETVRIRVSSVELQGLMNIWTSWGDELDWNDVVHQEQDGLYVEVWCFSAQRPLTAVPITTQPSARAALKARYARPTTVTIHAC